MLNSLGRFLFSPLFLIGQELKCEDFSKGTFESTAPEFPGVKWKIVRTKFSQKEWPIVIPKKYLELGLP